MGTLSNLNQNNQAEATGSKHGQGAAFYFAGFSNPHTTAIPNEVIDFLMPRISDAENRVLIYICRRTLGFGKLFDDISLSQFTDGIRRKDGTALDSGTGLGKPAVLRGIAGLEEKKIIWIKKNPGAKGGKGVSTYGLCFADDNVAMAKVDFANQKTYSISEYSLQKQEIAASDNEDSDIAALAFDGGSIATIPGVVSLEYQGNEPNLSNPGEIVPLSYQDGITTIPGVVSLEYQGSIATIPGVVSLEHQQRTSKQITSKQKIDNKQSGHAPVQVDALARQIDVDDDYSEVEKGLLKFGLPKQTLAKLTRQHSEEYLLEKIGAVQTHLRTNKIKNPAGFLLWAIDSDFQPAKPSLLEQELKFPLVAAMLADRQPLNPLAKDWLKLRPTLKKNNRKCSVAPSVSEPPLFEAASGEGHSSRPVYSDEQLTRPINRSTFTDIPALEVKPQGATEQEGRNFSSGEVLQGVLDDLRLRLGRPELLEHLRGARLDIQRLPEGFRVVLYLKENWYRHLINQPAQGAIKTALGWRLGSVCELEVAH